MERQSLCRFFANAIVLLLVMTNSMVTAAPYSVSGIDGRYGFVTHSINAPAQAQYDYIIVGGGTAGCPLAATLSRKYKVLLLERGAAPFEKPEVLNAVNFGQVLANSNDLNVSPAQSFQSLDGVFNRRARVLGGGTCINAGFYSRAETEWINLRKMNWARVNQSYSWVESVMVTFPSLGPWQGAVKDGLLEAGVCPYNGYTYDHLDGAKIGGTIFDSNGHRHTAADLLQYANPDNINVYTYATAYQIEFELLEGTGKPKATGVLYVDEDGNRHKAVLSGTVGSEVILSAGSMGSPQLLMLSGIGPAEHLHEFDIPIVLNQSGVGTGMADNPTVTMLIPSREPLETSLISTVGILKTGFYIEAASGAMIAFGEVQSLNTLEPKFRTAELVQNFSATIPFFSTEAVSNISQSGVLLGKIASPVSKGFLRLTSTSIRANPSVRFNYFEDVQDLYACVEGVRVMVQLLRTSAFTNITHPKLPEDVLTWGGFIAPLALDTMEPVLLAQWCRSTVVTLWHFHGGAQEGVVVDDSYKVLGVDALRVIDGSTFNSSPGTNPQATLLMIGRYMGLEIVDERARKGKS